MCEMGNAYIFTHGTQYSDVFRWYIDNCEPGWDVMRYCDFTWR